MPTDSLISSIDALPIMIVFFVIMMACFRLGRTVAMKRQRPEKEGAVSAAVYGLLAFMLAFSFGMSTERFDARRAIIVEEANAIGTAILLADLYPDEERSAFRVDFKQYLESRIAYYEEKRNLEGVSAALKEAEVRAKNLWKRASNLSRRPELNVASLRMIPSLNEMMDDATTRSISERSRVPDSIVIMLFCLSFASAFLLGYSSAHARIDWLLPSVFCLLTSVVIFITLDLDRPRRGLIDLSVSHGAMLELRTMFEEK